MDTPTLELLNTELTPLTAEERLLWCVSHYGSTHTALASSLGMEDQVLTHMGRSLIPDLRIFSLDTGRLVQETYDLMTDTESRYQFRYEILFPDFQDLERFYADHGPNGFYISPDIRKTCCHIRKVAPLSRQLTTLTLWITGLRRAQNVTREAIPVLEWDDTHQLLKCNPLFDWTEAMVLDYAATHHIPLHPFHAQGFPSLGCAPCTRAITPGEDSRAGRWWWEQPENRECGLHTPKHGALK